MCSLIGDERQKTSRSLQFQSKYNAVLTNVRYCVWTTDKYCAEKPRNLWYCGTKKYRKGQGTGTIEKWCRGSTVVLRNTTFHIFLITYLLAELKTECHCNFSRWFLVVFKLLFCSEVCLCVSVVSVPSVLFSWTLVLYVDSQSLTDSKIRHLDGQRNIIRYPRVLLLHSAWTPSTLCSICTCFARRNEVAEISGYTLFYAQYTPPTRRNCFVASAVWTQFATSSRRLPADSVDNLKTDQTDSVAFDYTNFDRYW